MDDIFIPYHFQTSTKQKVQLLGLLFGILLISGSFLLLVLNNEIQFSKHHRKSVVSDFYHDDSWIGILNEIFATLYSYLIYYLNEIGRTLDHCLDDHVSDGLTSGSSDGCFSRLIRPKSVIRGTGRKGSSSYFLSSSSPSPSFILFPKDIPSNYRNVTRVGKIPPKIRNGHHCPFNGFRKHTHYMFSQTVLPTLCYHNIENDLYCDLTEVRENFQDRLSPHAFMGFNKDRRVRSFLFAQCCDNFDFRFNFKKRMDLNSTRIADLSKIVPRPVLDQIYNSLLMQDLIRYEDLPRAFNWNTLNIQEFLDEKTKRLLEDRWPDILYHHSRLLASLKFGMWAHAFTKFGTCVTGQIYHNYVEQAFLSSVKNKSSQNSEEMLNEIRKRMKLEHIYHSDPELYFELIILLNSRFDYFKRKHGQLLREHFPPTLNRTYSAREIKQRIQQLFQHDVLLTCVWSTKYSHRLLYQIHTCMNIQQVEPLAFYLIERRQKLVFQSTEHDDDSNDSQVLSLLKDPTIKKLLSQIQPESCLSVTKNYNRTRHSEIFHHNVTDMWNHWNYHGNDEPTLLHTRECEDESQVFLPDAETILKLFSEEPSSGKIIKIPTEESVENVKLEENIDHNS